MVTHFITAPFWPAFAWLSFCSNAATCGATAFGAVEWWVWD